MVWVFAHWLLEASVFGDFEKQSSRTLALIAVALVLAIGIYALYMPSAKKVNFFLFDDHVNIVENSNIRITDINMEQIARAATTLSGLPNRRNLSFVSFGLDYYRNNLNPAAFTVTNVQLLIATSITLLLFSYYLFTYWMPPNKALIASMIATAVWTFHPLQVNQVFYIVQRMSLLACLGYFGSFAFFLMGLRHSRWLWVVSAMFACIAIFSKEVAYVLPVAMLVFWCTTNENASKMIGKRKWLLWAAGGLGVLALYLVGAVVFSELYLERDFSMGERLLTQPRVIWFYISQALLPLPSRLSLLHDFTTSVNLFTPWTTLLAIVAHLAVLISVAFFWRRHKLPAMLIMFFYLHHLVESTTLGIRMVFEHRMLLPGTFLCMLLGYLLVYIFDTFDYTAKRKHAFGFVFAVLLASVLSFATHERAKAWASPTIFWEDVTSKAPLQSGGWHNLGKYYLISGRIDDAEVALQTALRLDPADGKILTEIGLLYSYKKDCNTAIAYFKKAIDFGFDHHDTHYNLGMCYQTQRDYIKAVDEYSLSIKMYPGITDARYNMANIFYRLGKVDLARKYLKEEMAVAPHNNAARVFLNRIGY